MSEENIAKEKYHLSLKGPGITINKIVDPRTAGAIAQMTFGGHEPDAPCVDQAGVLGPMALRLSVRRASIREYLQTAALDRGIHTKILAVGQYMRDLESQSDFSREDIRSRFRSAGEPQPANFPRDFQKALRAGWIAEDHQNRGRYYVTRTGDEEIHRRQGQVSAAGPTRPRSRNRRVAIDDDANQ
jgi:hypothetical protein